MPADLDDAFPELAFGGNDVLSEVGAQLPMADMARSLCTCKAWQSVLDGSPHLWRALCAQAWADKMYVPESLRTMSEGDFLTDEVMTRNLQQDRQALMALKISELKNLMRSLRMQAYVGELIEKGDFADAIMDARRKAAETYTATQLLLRQPHRLVKQSENLPKAALRLSLADANRLRITEDELLSLVFSVRLRNDGPLANAMQFDPWWQGKGSGKARFSNDGRLLFTWPVDHHDPGRFAWPPDPADPDSHPMDPFAAMGMSDATLGWELQMNGSLVQILFDGQSGPQEVVCRHPNWGWVFYSGGTCWTSWPMPAYTVEQDGEKVMSDPLLREQRLSSLSSEIPRQNR